MIDSLYQLDNVRKENFWFSLFWPLQGSDVLRTFVKKVMSTRSFFATERNMISWLNIIILDMYGYFIFVFIDPTLIPVIFLRLFNTRQRTDIVRDIIIWIPSRCQNRWLINENDEKFDCWYYKWIPWPNNTICTSFHKFLIMFDNSVTMCQNRWIINEKWWQNQMLTL